MAKNPKRKMRLEADRLFKQAVLLKADNKCEVCGSAFGITAHHFIPRSLASHLIHYLPNGVCLCQGCHFAHHTKDDPAIDEAIKQKRGQKWFLGLIKRRKEKHYSFKTLTYYKKIIEELNQYLNEN